MNNTNNNEKAKEQWNKLSEEVRAILLGTMMGAGSVGITRGYVNARVSFRHSKVQTEYFKWKRDKLRREISVDKTEHENNKDTTQQEVKTAKEYGTSK